MKTPQILPLTALALIAAFSPSCGPSAPEAVTTDKIDFVNDVKPILQTQCIRCHNDQSIMGGLNLMTKEMVNRGSSRGPVLIPGDPEKSSLYRVTLLPKEQDHAMPATGAILSEAEKKIIYQWIKEGAAWPEGEAGTLQPVVIDNRKA